MNELDQFIDQVKQLEKGAGFVEPKSLAKKMEKFCEEYAGSYLDGYLIADALATIAEAFKNAHGENAYSEYLMLHGEQKDEHKGITITPVESNFSYDYEDDAIRDKYLKELETVAELIEPFKAQEKTIKASIKSREKTLVEQGKAVLLSSNKILKIARK